MKKQSIISDVELIYKKTEFPVQLITGSEEAARICRTTLPEGKIGHCEFFGLLLMNRGNRVVRRCIISMGGLNSTVVDPKVIFQYVWATNASGIILFHNHPSGTVKPSEQDLRLTRRIKDAAAILDISLLDHIILSPYEDIQPNYFSFADDGLM